MKALTASLAIFVLGSTAATAQSRCGPREALLEVAFQQYQERQVALALATGGSVLEILATRNGETFTMLLTAPNGISCVLATGENWQPKTWQPPSQEDAGS
jgi:hypothetical protein